MKQLLLNGVLLLITFLIVCCTGIAQKGEFIIHDNGLIYSDQTMNQLAYIVDSLNLKYKSCSLDRTYTAEPQAIAHRIRFAAERLEEVKEQLDRGISFEAFVKEYPEAEVLNKILVTRSIRKDNLIFTTYHSGQESSNKIYLEGAAKRAGEPWLGKWVYKDIYGEDGITALYFTQDFISPKLPDYYGRLVQYVDCMVDTSTNIYTAKVESFNRERDTNKAVENFLEYVDKVLGRPAIISYEKWEKMGGQEQMEHDSVRQTWYDKREENVRSLWDTDEKFRTLLDTALVRAKATGNSDEEFEEYVEWFYSKEEALELKRGRRVIGMCSMDTAPRQHAVDIARLSAETVNWEVFLRAHLDVMNDRFHRVTDGNYAWGSRSTYLRELEELQINVPDLMFGMCLRVDNPSQNHYYGSINRIGRALSETQQPEFVEARFLEMVADETLDDFNRLLLFFAYTHYCYHQEENEEAFKARTDAAMKLLPVYLQLKQD